MMRPSRWSVSASSCNASLIPHTTPPMIWLRAVLGLIIRPAATASTTRVTRVVDAVAAGKILNPKTARSQIIGGVVFGIGMALREETLTDHALGRFMTHNLNDYHLPVCADVYDIDVIFLEEHDDKTSPIGVKGLGEIGIVGTAAAIANAVYHATGKRIRDLPITIDKVLEAS